MGKNNNKEVKQMNTGNQEDETPKLRLSKFIKGYGWTINLWNYDIVELEKLNNEMLKKFGNKE